MYMVNFNMGFCLDGNEGLICYILDEHNNETDLLKASENDFIDFIKQLESEYLKLMEDYYNAQEDVIKLKNIKLKTFNPESLLDKYKSNTFKPFLNGLGNLALIKNYKPELYVMVLDFLNNFPKTKDKVLNNGREARGGVSILETYDKLCKEEVMKKFSIKIIKDNQ